MDPVSISVACVSLTASIAKTSVAVTRFVHSIRSARSDLDGVSRELASLKTLLELITEDAKDVETFPETLRKHISGILANCELVLVEVQRLIVKYDKRAPSWVWTGSEDVARLQLSLEAHKSALEIALEMVALSVSFLLVICARQLTSRRSMSKQIINDTTQLREDTTTIKQDTSDILKEIARLRDQLPSIQVTHTPLTGDRDLILARYLDDLTSYAETVCWSEVNDDDMDLYDQPSPAHGVPLTLNVSTKPPILPKTSIALSSSDAPNSVYRIPSEVNASQITITESSAPSHRSVATDPFASVEQLDDAQPSYSPSSSSAATAESSSQLDQEVSQKPTFAKSGGPEASRRQSLYFKQESTTSRSRAQVQYIPPRNLHGTDAVNTEVQTKSMPIGQNPHSLIPSTDPREWTSSGHVQHSRGNLLAWHQNIKTKELVSYLLTFKNDIIDDCSRW
jgi:uncharacterized protein YoxC